jgi:glyoxylase I family protein
MAKLLSRPPERLHHHAYVVKDQEKNRQFFEDVLGIPLTATWCEKHFNAWVGRDVSFCHTFYSLGGEARRDPEFRPYLLQGKRRDVC